jgi:hypothetical protein
MTHRRLIESLNLCFVILLFICLTGQCSGPADLASVETQTATTDQPE